MKKVLKISLSILLIILLAFVITGCGVITLAIKGEDIYMDIDATSDHMSIMYKDDTTYVISHADKMYMTSEGKDEELFEEDDNLAIFSVEDLNAMAEAHYTTGKEDVNGTEYDYEEFKDEETGVSDKYYFSGEDLIYIKTINENGEEDIMKVIKLSSEVDDNIFNIPTGYEKLEV